MNEESLSALLDGECSPSELDRLLEEMARNPRLREHFSRLRLARDSRRGLRIRKARLDFADGVLAALDRSSARPRFRWVHGLALAATLAGAAVLVMWPQPASQPPAVAVSPPAATPVAIAAPADWAALDALSSHQLRAYLLRYNRARVQQGMAGTLGYARLAAYTADAPKDQP